MTRRTGLRVEPLADRRLPSFSPAVSFAVGTSPMEIVTADFNNDGNLDLAMTTQDAMTGRGAVSVLLGDERGGFGPAIHSAAGSGLDALAVGDFNTDGNLDLATTDSAGVAVHLGNGDGAFQPPVQVPLLNDDSFATPFSVAAADFNLDGKSDLVVTGGNVFGGVYGYIEVLLGDGAGVFTTSDSISDFQTLSLLAVGDLNADGIPDLAVTDDIETGTSWISVWLGNGDGTLRNSYWASGPSNLAGAVGDFTGDGIPDLVTTGETLDIRPGLGDGTFAPPSHSASGPWQWTAAAADVTGDSKLDVLTANVGTHTVSVLPGLGGGTLSAPFDHAAGSAPRAVAVADFNGDSRMDAAVTDSIDRAVWVLLNDGSWDGPPPPPPPPSIRVTDVTGAEGRKGRNTFFTFTVTLSTPCDQPVTVSFRTADGTATTGGSDYAAKSGTLMFAPGETTKTVTIEVKGDNKREADETFYLDLFGNSGNSLLVDGRGLGTILNDD
jgi:Calx-beta domain/FG-GAP-like repeat/FG-GAP repeat